MNMRTSFIIFSLLAILFGSGCSPTYFGMATPQEMPSSTPVTRPGDSPTSLTADHKLTIFAAASLTDAFNEIGDAFELDHPGLKVNFNFAGSQILRTQLEQGAQADIFASADYKNMEMIVAEKLVNPEDVHEFATNSLIVILPATNPGKVKDLIDLTKPKLKIVLADESVPAGNYVRQMLVKISQDAGYGSDFGDKVLANVVSNETDVKQVLTKVELGEADAGIVYASDAVAAPDLITLAIPDKFNIIAQYPIALLSRSPEAKIAAAFIMYVTSLAGQKIMEKWGFSSPNQ
jgi:molybdate transport system substrate-binding protein